MWGWCGEQPYTPTARLEHAIRGQDPALYGQTVARLVFDFAPDAAVNAFAQYISQSCEPDVLVQGVHANDTRDIRHLLDRVTQPVLITQSRNNKFQPMDEARRLAAALPNAELVFVDDPFFADSMPHWIRFLSGDTYRARAREASLRTILFTDIEGHSAIMSRLGDAKGRDVLREHERLTREALRHHGGSEVKSMGDGFMASFGSAQRAIECARAIQVAFANAVLGEALKVRIGINAGEPVAEDDDLFGASVITAARIAAKADGGVVLVANVVRELVAGKGFLFHDTGEHVLKGFEEPARLWELRLEGA
jgi:class 3 adenylate cyclase